VRPWALAVALVILAPGAALAQTTGDGDASALLAEVERDYAAAQGADCDTACRALDSMRRAADRLCVLDPGARCAQARQRVAAATDRVRASCPGCPQTLEGTTGTTMTPQAPPATPAPAGAPPQENAAKSEQVAREESAPPRGGGCAGCAMGARGGALDGAAGALLSLLVFLGRRRRTRS
jgi:hypothetical protein